MSFDGENADDESGNGNNGEMVGSPSFVEGVKGKAIYFQNPEERSQTATQYVNFGQPEELKFSEGSFSIMFWYKASASETKEASIVSNKNWASGDNPGFNIGDMKEGLNLNFNTVNSGKNRSETDRFSGATDDAWHHVAAVIDRQDQNQIALYFDGKEAFGGSGKYGSKKSTASVSGYTGAVDVLDFVLGADGEKKRGVNNAYVDELYVYDCAVTQEDIKAVIEDAKPPVAEEIELVLKVSFDNENADDESGNESNGTVVGNPEYTEGVRGKAIHFQNPEDRSETATQYVDFGQPDNLKFGEGSFSVMFWYKADGNVKKEGAIISNKDWSSGENAGFNIGDMVQGINLNLNMVSSGKGRAETDRFSGATDNTWHHVAAVVDRRQGQMTLYIDGKDAFGGSGSFGSKTNTVNISAYFGIVDVTNLVLGADGVKKRGVGDAYVDELSIYKGALNQQYIAGVIENDTALLALEKMESYVNDQKPGCRFPEDMIQNMKEKLSEAKEQLLKGECEDVEVLLSAIQSEYDIFLNGAEANMSFHMISDTHVQNETGTAGKNFAKGLQDMQNINPSASALVSAGDNTQNGGESEVNSFFKILDENNPVADGKTMIALGNHDVRGSSGYWEDFPVEENAYWKIAYNLYMTNNEKYMPETDGKTYFDYWVNGYHFIMLNPENSAKDTAYLTDGQLEWLDEKLGENEDISRPAFVIIHQALNDTHWRSYMYNGFGPQDEAVKEILSKHPQTIVLSGHIHNGFGITEAIDRPYGTVVDVPAFIGSSYGLTEAGTGYEVYIYDDEVLLRARNFVTSTWMPEYDISVKLKNLPALVAETGYVAKENYTAESWALASPKIEKALAEAGNLMNQEYEKSTTLPDMWYYHKDGREKLEELCRELKAAREILEEKDVIWPVKVSLTKTHLHLSEGDSCSLKAKILPENTTDTSLNWSTSDQDVVSVDEEGNVTANTAGIAVITVSAANGKTAQCTVNVESATAVINTKLPVRYIGQLYELPDTINVTFKNETFDTRVTWNEDEVEALLGKEETGKYSVTGTLEEVGNREVQAEVVVAPGNVVYFVDSGASSFTEKGQLLAEANNETMKNTVPDQAYDADSGWGFTNSQDDLEASGSGDAYTTIRNFKGEHNGITLTYQFELEAGSYDVTAGFYDPWSQWAGDWRHAKLSVTDGEGKELASIEDYHISGNKETVQFHDVVLKEDGSLGFHAAPLNNENDSCDMMISFIVITRKDVLDSGRKDGLRAAITIAEALDAERYTEESYAVLADAIEEAKVAYATNGLGDAQIQNQINRLAEAVKSLKAAAEEENSQLSNELEQKIQELAGAKAESEKLSRELQNARSEVDSLTSQLEEETEKVTSLTAELDAAKQELAQLREEAGDTDEAIGRLNARIAELESALEQAENEKGRLEAQRKEAEEKAERLETKLAEVQSKITILEAENAQLTKEAQELREALKKAETEEPLKLKTGDSAIVKGVKYRVTDASKKQAQAYGVEKKSLRTISVAANVKVNGVTCSVTSIADKAFAGCKKVQKAVIGKNVGTIGKKAFYGDKALRSIQVKSKKIKSVGKQAWKGIHAKAVIKVPKAKKRAYSRSFAGKGQKKTVKIKG